MHFTEDGTFRAAPYSSLPFSPIPAPSSYFLFVLFRHGFRLDDISPTPSWTNGFLLYLRFALNLTFLPCGSKNIWDRMEKDWTDRDYCTFFTTAHTQHFCPLLLPLSFYIVFVLLTYFIIFFFSILSLHNNFSQTVQLSVGTCASIFSLVNSSPLYLFGFCILTIPFYARSCLHAFSATTLPPRMHSGTYPLI